MKAGAGLVVLDLSDNAFGPNGIVGLVALLKSSSCYTLQELRLNNNGLGITGGKVGLKLRMATFQHLYQFVMCSEIDDTITLIQFQWNISAILLLLQVLAECLTECHQNSVKAGKPLKLKVFVSGRNRLENPGATALAAVFKVMDT